MVFILLVQVQWTSGPMHRSILSKTGLDRLFLMYVSEKNYLNWYSSAKANQQAVKSRCIRNWNCDNISIDIHLHCFSSCRQSSINKQNGCIGIGRKRDGPDVQTNSTLKLPFCKYKHKDKLMFFYKHKDKLMFFLRYKDKVGDPLKIQRIGWCTSATSTKRKVDILHDKHKDTKRYKESSASSLYLVSSFI